MRLARVRGDVERLVYALFVEVFIHREMRLVDFYGTAVETAKLLGKLFPIVEVALSLKTPLTIEETPDALALWITEATTTPIMFLLAMNLRLLVVGCLFDVIMVINLEIGFRTPPLGLNLIVAMTAFKESFLTIPRSFRPFILLILLILLIVIYMPVTAPFFLG